jgi:hypothetical protein
MEEAPTELHNYERLRSTLREVSAQVSDLRQAPPTLTADERGEMYAMGREITQLGLETQLWAYGFRHQEGTGVREVIRARRSARTTG